MAESYRRRCKYCGRWIQLRQMPHGQWVAFEGYDTVHDCEKQPSSSNKSYTSTNYSSQHTRGNYSRSYQSSGSGCLLILIFILAASFSIGYFLS